MGAYSPAPVVTDEVRQRVCEKIITPTLAGLTKVGIRYTGFLYAGLMIDEDGNPRVIEFNCRFGDPETQPIMLRLESDLAEVCLAAVEHRLKDQQLIFTEQPALAVVVASAGYPQRYETGALITGLDEPRQSEVFHAGTALVEGELRVSGGRVVALVAKGASVSEAQAQVYRDLKQLQFAGRYFRTDIGYRAIAREQH
jgi:phosphoribosylamine--glycine ligase